jgi:hypothetical protein
MSVWKVKRTGFARKIDLPPQHSDPSSDDHLQQVSSHHLLLPKSHETTNGDDWLQFVPWFARTTGRSSRKEAIRSEDRSEVVLNQIERISRTKRKEREKRECCGKKLRTRKCCYCLLSLVFNSAVSYRSKAQVRFQLSKGGCCSEP